MAHDDDERRWRKALQKLGTVGVRRKLQQSADDDASHSGIATGTSHPPRKFVEDWYREAQQRIHRAKHVRSYVLAVLALAVVAAGIVFLAS